MKIRKTLILFSAAVLSLLLFSANVMAQFHVKLVTEPRAGRIVPNGEAAKFTVSVTDYAGRPVPFARLRLTLYSPKKTFIPANFPWTEDSALFHIQSYIVNGAYSFYYRVPVRGTHRLVVSVFDPQHNIKYKKTIPIAIYVSTAELLRIFLYMLLFFSIGLLAGMLFEKSKAAAIVSALAVLLFFPSASSAQAGKRLIMKSDAPLEELAKKLTYSLSVKITPERGVAGKMTEIKAVLLDHKKNMVIVPVYFEFETVNARDNSVLFHDTVYALKGKAKNQVQLFSGENHIVKINAYLKNPEGLNLKPSASFKKEIPVQPFKTPKDAAAKTAVFLLCAAGAGAFAGRRIERKRHGDARRSRVL